VSAVSDHGPTPSGSWRTLLTWLAYPFAASALLLAAWFLNGRRPLDGGFVPVLTAVSVTFSALWCLRKVSVDALVLPTPLMMWSLFGATDDSKAPFVGVLLSHAGCAALLVACCYEKRPLARGAAIVCGAALIWLRWPR